MTRQIIIENDMVKEVEVRLLSEAPLDAMIASLTTATPTRLPIIPTGTKYIDFDPEQGRCNILIERPPKRYNIRTAGAQYKLQFPYQYFWIPCSYTVSTTAGRMAEAFHLQTAYLLWRKEPYRSLEDLFWNARVANVGGDAAICWGNTFRNADSFVAQVERVVSSFDETEFNGDLGWMSPQEYGSYRAWEAASDNPAAFLSWRMFDGPGRNIQQLIADTTMRHDELPTPDFDNSFINLPEFPENFSTARAMAWLETLTPTQRKRMIVAASTTPTPKVRLTPEPSPDPLTEPSVEPEAVIVSSEHT